MNEGQNNLESKARYAGKKEAYRAKLSTEIADKMKEQATVWQTPREVPAHMPVNPTSTHYFQKHNAMILLQRQYELKTPDPRWVRLSQLKGLDAMVKKGERSTALETTDKNGVKGFSNYINLSQCHPVKEKSFGSIEIYDLKEDAKAEMMLKHNTLTLDKVLSSSDAFFEIADKAYVAAGLILKEQQALRDSMQSRLDAIKAADLTKKPTTAMGVFLQECKKNMEANPEKKNYVIEAAKAMLLNDNKKYSKAKIKEMITKYAPEAIHDNPAKGKKYSEFILDVIQKDVKFQKAYKKIEEAKGATR